MRGIPVGKKKLMQDSVLVTGAWCGPLADWPVQFLGRGDALLYRSAHPIRQRQKERRPGILPGSVRGEMIAELVASPTAPGAVGPLHMVLPPQDGDQRRQNATLGCHLSVG